MSECTHNCETCHAKCSERQGEMPPSRLDKIKHKLLVLSGKGGVGKSTMAAGLAVSLAKAGYKVALLDVDFHGPSQPTLFGLKDHRLDGDEEGINPAETASGVKLVSLGLLVDNSNAAV
ncbi:MAG: P-loop NTPase, partial [Lentisphaeria bacterium]|nr:P-loop NTPase [Lentisphaeria bacterium]